MSTKRVIDLANKLQHKENERLLEKLPIWITESEDWARKMMGRYGPNGAQKDIEGYRLLYILNHLCPSLYHFHRQPDPKRFMGDIDGYNAAAQKHFLENTQAGLLDSDGTLIQEGVHYDAENLNAFLSEARPYCDKHLEQLWNELEDVPFDDQPESDMTLTQPWHGFPVGTEREDIWRWFGARYTRGVAALLYGRSDSDDTE